MARKKEKQDIGHRVSRRLGEMDAERFTELHRLRTTIEKYEAVKGVLEELGIKVHDWHLRETIRARFKGLHPGVERKLNTIEALVAEVLQLVRRGED